VFRSIPEPHRVFAVFTEAPLGGGYIGFEYLYIDGYATISVVDSKGVAHRQGTILSTSYELRGVDTLMIELSAVYEMYIMSLKTIYLMHIAPTIKKEREGVKKRGPSKAFNRSYSKYTYIDIFNRVVYDKQDKPSGDKRKSPVTHVRRGHTKRVHTKEGMKYVFIKPTIVGTGPVVNRPRRLK